MSTTNISNIPNAFICPITLNIMEDPYSDSDGNTFEKTAIYQWIQQTGISPVTRNPMTLNDLHPNRALKDLIENFINGNEIPITSVTSVEEINRDKVCIIMIPDTSGSMEEICLNKNLQEVLNYTRLDLVKHTMNTIIDSLSIHDEIAIVEFNTAAKALTGIIPVNQTNKTLLHTKVNLLRGDGGTNIWDALRVAIELTKSKDLSDFDKIHLMLFTDGVSNNDPPRGILPVLKTYFEKNYNDKICISTFGFGNNIASPLLYEIAQNHNGLFGFIPDSTMIGTVFINTLAHIMSEKYNINNNIDQTQEVFINNLIEIIHKRIYKYDNINELNLFCDKITKCTKDNFLNDLLVDCKETQDDNEGQISKAFNQIYFDTWGKHYLYSIMSAYAKKVCINFKDKGIQHFKTPQFKEMQEFIENIFINMEPPKPTGQNAYDYNSYNNNNNNYNNNNNNSPVNNISSQQFSQTFYNRAGGCFLQDTMIKVLDNEEGVKFIPVQDVTSNTKVITHKGIANVICVIKMKYNGIICRLNESSLTAFHPIFFTNEEWLFPNDSKFFVKETVNDTYVYDFILDKDHTVKLFDFYACTLNHGKKENINKKEDNIIEHDYFGTNKVQNDLMKHPGWQEGYITLEKYEFIRDENNKVVSLTFEL